MFFLQRRAVIRRRLQKAAADLAAGVDQVGAKLEGNAHAEAEKARAEFVAAFHRFEATLHELEGRADGGVADIVEGIDVPIHAIDQALDRAGVDLGADARHRAIEAADLRQG